MSRESAGIRQRGFTAFYQELLHTARVMQAKCIILVLEQPNGNPSSCFSFFQPPNRPQCGFIRNPLQLIRTACCPDFSRSPQLQIVSTASRCWEIHNSFERSLPPLPPYAPTQNSCNLFINISYNTNLYWSAYVVSLLGKKKCNV